MVASLFYLQDCYSNRSEISQLVTRECWDVFSIFSLQPGTVKVARKLCVAESRCFLFLCNLSSCLTRIKNGNITGCLTIVFFNQPPPPPHPHRPGDVRLLQEYPLPQNFNLIIAPPLDPSEEENYIRNMRASSLRGGGGVRKDISRVHATKWQSFKSSKNSFFSILFKMFLFSKNDCKRLHMTLDILTNFIYMLK